MKKSLEDKREERLAEIAKLTKDRDTINARLNFLTGVADTTNAKPEESEAPFGFSVTKEVEALFNDNAELRILQATAILQKKFPYKIERRQVHSALVYLLKRGKISKGSERGQFIRKQESSP